MTPQTHINVHGASCVSAIARPIHGMQGFFATLEIAAGGAEIVIYLDDVAYAARLADAINAAAPQPEQRAA